MRVGMGILARVTEFFTLFAVSDHRWGILIERRKAVPA
jgi:hypothetical protein